jgi:hypothetical protein
MSVLQGIQLLVGQLRRVWWPDQKDDGVPIELHDQTLGGQDLTRAPGDQCPTITLTQATCGVVRLTCALNKIENSDNVVRGQREGGKVVRNGRMATWRGRATLVALGTCPRLPPS